MVDCQRAPLVAGGSVRACREERVHRRQRRLAAAVSRGEIQSRHLVLVLTFQIPVGELLQVALHVLGAAVERSVHDGVHGPRCVAAQRVGAGGEKRTHHFPRRERHRREQGRHAPRDAQRRKAFRLRHIHRRTGTQQLVQSPQVVRGCGPQHQARPRTGRAGQLFLLLAPPQTPLQPSQPSQPARIIRHVCVAGAETPTQQSGTQRREPPCATHIVNLVQVVDLVPKHRLYDATDAVFVAQDGPIAKVMVARTTCVVPFACRQQESVDWEHELRRVVLTLDHQDGHLLPRQERRTVLDTAPASRAPRLEVAESGRAVCLA
mmetsp:Transcript_13222/g.30127  ORF Transcript_13222/g.30127 Transcript_13222/m.30127 type:complete len:320 (+) Transcript_13222:755-1714(+)